MFRKGYATKADIALFLIWAISGVEAVVGGFYEIAVANDTLAEIVGIGLCIVASISVILTILLFKKGLNFLSTSLLLLFPLLVCLTRCFFSLQLDYLLCNIYFFVVLLYFLLAAFLNISFLNQELFGQALIVFLYAGFWWIKKYLDLSTYVTTAEIIKTVDDMAYAFWIAGVAAVVLTMAFFLVQKDRTVRQGYGKRMGQLAAMVFACVAIVSVISAPNLNFAFDATLGQTYSCNVKEKYVEYGHGIYSLDSYYIVVDFKQGQKKIQLPFKDYESLKPGDTVTVVQHEGALGFTYYQYQKG